MHMCRKRVTTATHARTRLTAGEMYIFLAVRINRSDELCRPFLKIPLSLVKLSLCAYRISATNNLGGPSFFQIYQDRRRSITLQVLKVLLKISFFFNVHYFTTMFRLKLKYCADDGMCNGRDED